MIDLGRYFARIGYSGQVEVGLDTLNGIMQAQAQSVPFENLDVLLGRPIDLSPDALERKIVTEHRGGYCFEQNGLLLHVLQAIGFHVTPLSARVRYQRPRDYTPARTHLFLSVQIGGAPWVADVGVGNMSLTSAFRLDLDGEQPTLHEPRRILREGSRYFHQARLGDDWHDVLEFTGEEMPGIDRELANWFTSAHPQSHFRNRLITARALPDGQRLTLLNRELTLRSRNGEAQTRTIHTPAELVRVLHTEFGLHFPEGTIFPCDALDWPEDEKA